MCDVFVYKGSPGFDSHLSRFSAFYGRKREINLSTRESKVECTTIKERTTCRKRTTREEKPGADLGLDQPRRMLSVGGRIEHKGTSFVRS